MTVRERLEQKYGKNTTTPIQSEIKPTENAGTVRSRLEQKYKKEKLTAGVGEYTGEDIVGDIKQTGQALKKTVSETAEKILEPKRAMEAGEQGLTETIYQSAGAAAEGISRGIGDVFTGAVKGLLPEKNEQIVKSNIAGLVGKLSEFDKKVGSPVGSTMEKYNQLSDRTKRNLGALVGIGSLATDILGAGAGKKVATTGLKQAEKATAQVSKIKIPTIPPSGPTGTVIQAAKQTGGELLERIPRSVAKAQETIQETAQRSKKIKESTPVVANAIKSNLDERIINTIAESDLPTIKAYKQVVDIAEETTKTIGMKKQPSIVSGELAAKQYDLINKQKNKIGKEIGEKVKELSKTDKIDISDAVVSIEDTLSNSGIGIKYTKKGTKLDFSGTNFTPAERTKIEQLYKLSTEGGWELTPNQIKAKDQLFSKLQRESAIEGIGKIMIETPEGTKSLFSIFRDIYSKKIDDISPEIRALNKKYRDLILITDDIEDSILRTPNFNITKTADPAEFAKVNLRRIFGESQSSPVFEAIADQMDTLARSLGYKEASPKQVAEFAQELRKLYPESIPKTGFQGGISGGISGLIGRTAETVLKAGAPDVKDQKKALIDLLNSYLLEK